jgi:excisionase family DNA binding protein
MGASIDETAAALNLRRDSIYRLVADGRLTVSKLGRRTIVHVSSIHLLLAETVVKPRPRMRHSGQAAAHQSTDPTV